MYDGEDYKRVKAESFDSSGDLGIKSATTLVNTKAATAPTSGQVLTATGDSAATWQTPSGGGGSADDDANQILAVQIFGG